MNKQIEKRLEELKLELKSGKQLLSELEAEKENTAATLLRISGAIQVLEELLENENVSLQGVTSSKAKTA